MHAWCSFAPCRLSFDTRNYTMHRFSTGTALYALSFFLVTIYCVQEYLVSSMTGHVTFPPPPRNFELCILFTLRVSALHSRARPKFGLARRFWQSRPASSFLYRPRSDRHGYERSDPGPHSLFSRTPENLVWRDGFGSTGPSQFFLYCPRSDGHR